MKSHVALVDYGAGNLKSVQHAFEFLGSKSQLLISQVLSLSLILFFLELAHFGGL